MNAQQQIAAGISAELARQGKTKTDLMEPLGLTQNSIYARFHSRTPFTTDELSEIANYLHMSFMDLMHRCLDLGETKSPQVPAVGNETERR